MVTVNTSAPSDAATGRAHAARNCAPVGGRVIRSRTRAARRVERKSSPSYRSDRASSRSRSKNLSSVIGAPVEVCKLFLQFPPRQREMRPHRSLAQLHHRRDLRVIELLDEI